MGGRGTKTRRKISTKQGFCLLSERRLTDARHQAERRGRHNPPRATTSQKRQALLSASTSHIRTKERPQRPPG